MDNNQLNFITTYLRHRSVYTAYCIAYNVEDQSQYESIMSTAQQLMDDPEVGGLIRSVLEHVHYEVEQEIRAELKTELLTIQRKRELLANIATGEMYAVQNYKAKDCNQCTQMVRPTINQMLKAIDLDNKMAGHYTVDKRQPANSYNSVEERTTESATNHNKIEEAPLLTKEGTLERASRHQPTGEVEHSRKTGNHNKTQQLSGAISLRPLNETSISQQIATNYQHQAANHDSPLIH